MTKWNALRDTRAETQRRCEYAMFNAICRNKAESPTKEPRNKVKAESLAYRMRHVRKAFSLEILCAPFRRALPYADVRKGFALWMQQSEGETLETSN